MPPSHTARATQTPLPGAVRATHHRLSRAQNTPCHTCHRSAARPRRPVPSGAIRTHHTCAFGSRNPLPPSKPQAQPKPASDPDFLGFPRDTAPGNTIPSRLPCRQPSRAYALARAACTAQPCTAPHRTARTHVRASIMPRRPKEKKVAEMLRCSETGAKAPARQEQGPIST